MASRYVCDRGHQHGGQPRVFRLQAGGLTLPHLCLDCFVDLIKYKIGVVSEIESPLEKEVEVSIIPEVRE